MLDPVIKDPVVPDGHVVDLLIDALLYEVPRHGKKRVPINDALDEALHEGLKNAWISLFRVERITGECVIIRDLINEDRPELSLIEFGFLLRARKGMGVFARVIPVFDFAQTNGWMYAVDREDVDKALDEHKSRLAEVSRRERYATSIGCFSQVRV
ncbi:MAG: hypothetical protein ACOYEP_09970 [Limnochordia bacterium]